MGGRFWQIKKFNPHKNGLLHFKSIPPPPHPTKTTGPQPGGGGLGKSDISCHSPVQACGLK